MPAAKGNQYKVKYKTAEDRKELFDQIIKHLESGFHQDHFPPCDWDTVESYCKKYPNDFPPDQIARAKRTGILGIEKLGHQGLFMGNHFNAKAWQFIMQNKTGWAQKHEVKGKQEHTFKDVTELSDEEIDRRIEERLNISSRSREESKKEKVGTSADQQPTSPATTKLGRKSTARAKKRKSKRKGRTAKAVK